MLGDDLDRMQRNPSTVTRRDLVAALRDAGFELARTRGKHEVWKHGAVKIAVPRTLKGSGTTRSIVEAVTEARRHPDGPKA